MNKLAITLVIGRSQRLRKEGNARITKVSAMRAGLAKIVEKIHISRYFKSPETDIHILENVCCIESSDTRLSKRVHWHSTSQSTNRSTTYYGCENMVEFDGAESWVSLLITRIHLRLPEDSTFQWWPATRHNTGWMKHRQVRHGTFEAIPLLEPQDVEEVNGSSASRHDCLQWNVPSSGWRYVIFSYEDDSIEGRLILCCEVCATDVLRILCWSDSNAGHASHFNMYPRSFPQEVIVWELGHGNA